MEGSSCVASPRPTFSLVHNTVRGTQVPNGEHATRTRQGPSHPLPATMGIEKLQTEGIEAMEQRALDGKS